MGQARYPDVNFWKIRAPYEAFVCLSVRHCLPSMGAQKLAIRLGLRSFGEKPLIPQSNGSEHEMKRVVEPRGCPSKAQDSQTKTQQHGPQLAHSTIAISSAARTSTGMGVASRMPFN